MESTGQVGATKEDCNGYKDVDYKLDNEKGNQLLVAAEKGRLLDLVKCIHENPSIINFVDEDHYTPLHRACYSGNLDCAKYLVRHGANIEASTTTDWRPLHCAVRWMYTDVAEYLIKEGANINARSSGNNTPLHIACSNGRFLKTCDIIQMLLYNPDCDYSIRNQSGDTAFDIAKRSGPFYRLWVGVATIYLDQVFSEKEGDDLSTD